MLLRLDVFGGRCIECAARKRRHGSASDRRDTPPVDVFFGVAAGLLARRSTLPPVFPMRSRISDVKTGATHCLQLRGQRRNLAKARDSPASLLATKSCDQADRDVYMSCYSVVGVNGNQAKYQKNLGPSHEAVKNIRRRIPRFDRVDARTGLPVSDPVVVLREAFPKLRGKPV